jgi:putative transposase
MPRPSRQFVPGLPQHVVTRGVNRQAVFFDSGDYLRFWQQLGKGAAMHKCQVHAYVLMTNHVHLLVTPGHADSLSQLMQWLGRRYVQWVNKKHERTGTLWQGRYRACLIEDDRYLLACHRYIELNPVRAGLSNAPGAYPYSSYAGNALGKPDRALTPHPLYLALHPDPEQRRRIYRGFFADELPESLLLDFRGAARGNRPLRESGHRENRVSTCESNRWIHRC